MKIKIYAVGKLKKGYFKQAADDYISRLRHYINIDVFELTEESILLSHKKENFNVILDRTGRQMHSLEFAGFLENHIARSQKDLAFFVGGAEGFPADFVASGDAVLSLSEMTFPHELARLIILEQLYRAFTIMRGEKYHK